jgi:hypothetical protein
MKKLFFLFALVTLVSCSKQSDRPATVTPATGSITYTIAGAGTTTYSGSYQTALQGQQGAYMLKQYVTPAPCYKITGQSGPNNIIQIGIAVDSLQVGSYEVPTGELYNTMVIIDGKTFNTWRPYDPQKLSVNVSSYSAGTVSGTFSGTLYYSPTGTFISDSIVVAGSFENLVCRY